MKRLIAAAAALAAVIVTAASAAELTIAPGVSIGKIKLGMTKAQAVRALGGDYFVNETDGTYTELAWDFASWTVGLEAGRVVQVSTTVANQRTKKGVGPGRTKWQQLMRAYPGGRCAWNLVRDDQTGRIKRDLGPEYLITHRGGAQTLFSFRAGFGRAAPILSQVAVRKPFRLLPEFQPDWPGYCRGDWRHRRAPLPGVRP